jgi:hypothetical protein
MTDRTIPLRSEHSGSDWRFLSARLNDAGDLLIEGQDIGPATAPVSSDGEYEWAKTVRAEFITNLLAVLDAAEDANILDVLETGWTADRSYELERRLRESAIPVEFWSHSG